MGTVGRFYPFEQYHSRQPGETPGEYMERALEYSKTQPPFEIYLSSPEPEDALMTPEPSDNEDDSGVDPRWRTGNDPASVKWRTSQFLYGPEKPELEKPMEPFFGYVPPVLMDNEHRTRERHFYWMPLFELDDKGQAVSLPVPEHDPKPPKTDAEEALSYGRITWQWARNRKAAARKVARKEARTQYISPPGKVLKKTHGNTQITKKALKKRSRAKR